jgi:hypothetical protein
MCEGYSKIRFAVIAFVVAITATHAFAQGGRGRSDSIRVPAPTSNDRPSRPAKRPLRTNRVSPPKVPLPETGRVTIRVNEGSSLVKILRDGTPIETIDLPERSTSLIIRKLDVGSYTVTAAKPGFHDETRNIAIEKNESRRVSIDLRPKMAVLSVASNVADAKISIDKLGDFERPVEKALVKPGLYKIKISRRGYVSRSLEVDLKISGSEENLNVILEPLRIDAVLDLAFEHIQNEKLDDAEALAGDVLALNPEHARGNLTLGMIALNRPDLDRAIDRVLLALSNGETFVLPVSIKIDDIAAQAIFKLDKHALAFEITDRPWLNIAIAREDLTHAETDGSALNIAGRSNFHGRPTEPRLVVFSPLAATDCKTRTTRRTCTSDVHLLRNLLAEWRK